MKRITLLMALILVLGLPCASQAHQCPKPNLGHLFLRLATPSFKPELTDREIVGDFWARLKAVKDAAHDNQLEAYADANNAEWVTLYGTPDELWAVLNSTDYHLRDVLRDLLICWHREKPQNTERWLEGRADQIFGHDTCGCAY